MKVFVSWSGDRSKSVALLLRDWLPKVIQAIKPWMSEVDIEPGARWLTTIGAELENTSMGIICVTSEALDSRWLNFEAGAIAKRLTESHVIPLLIDVGKADVTGPLSQFQLILPDRKGVAKLLEHLNVALGDQRIDSAVLDDAIETYWPRFETKLRQALGASGADKQTNFLPPMRDERDILEEILELVRDQHRSRMVVASPRITEYLTLQDFQRLSSAYRAIQGIEAGQGQISAASAQVLMEVGPVLKSVMHYGREIIEEERGLVRRDHDSDYIRKVDMLDLVKVVDGVKVRKAKSSDPET